MFLILTTVKSDELVLTSVLLTTVCTLRMSLVEYVYQYDPIPLFYLLNYLSILQKIPLDIWDGTRCVPRQPSVHHRHPAGRS